MSKRKEKNNKKKDRRIRIGRGKQRRKIWLKKDMRKRVLCRLSNCHNQCISVRQLGRRSWKFANDTAIYWSLSFSNFYVFITSHSPSIFFNFFIISTVLLSFFFVRVLVIIITLREIQFFWYKGKGREKYIYIYTSWMFSLMFP